MFISIVIPTCNRNDLLTKCLNLLAPSVQKVDFEYQVIVTDDSANGNANQLIHENYHWAEWVEGPRKGPAANRNNGALKANAEWLLFIDDDCLPDENILKHYAKGVAQNKQCSVFEGAIKVDREQSNFLEESPINENGGHLWSCNFMIDRKVFLDVLQGFDDSFPFAAMEDVDMNYRIQLSNIPVVFLKEAFVVHPWRIQKRLIKITFQRFESTLHFLKKHPEKKAELNSRFFIVAFVRSSTDAMRKMFRYRFRGFGTRMASNFLQLYFSLRILSGKH